MPELVIAGMIGWLCGLSLALWEHRKKQNRLQEAIEQFEYDRTRTAWLRADDTVEAEKGDSHGD